METKWKIVKEMGSKKMYLIFYDRLNSGKPVLMLDEYEIKDMVRALKEVM